MTDVDQAASIVRHPAQAIAQHRCRDADRRHPAAVSRLGRDGRGWSCCVAPKCSSSSAVPGRNATPSPDVLLSFTSGTVSVTQSTSLAGEGAPASGRFANVNDGDANATGATRVVPGAPPEHDAADVASPTPMRSPTVSNSAFDTFVAVPLTRR